jgi:CMP-N-acetylneuraminic acid synthetase
MSRVLAVIPARGGSKGIPKKNIVKINRKPLIGYAIEACLESVTIDKLVVSTDCDEIAKVVNRYGKDLVLKRPDHIATDEASSESTLIHAIERFPEYDIIVLIQCTSPLTTTEDIDNCVRILIDNYHINSAFTVCEFDHFLWGREKVVIPEVTVPVGIGHDHKLPRQRRQVKKPTYLETGAVYCMRSDPLLEFGHRFIEPMEMSIMSKERCFEIDEPLDLEIAKVLLKRNTL